MSFTIFFLNLGSIDLLLDPCFRGDDAGGVTVDQGGFSLLQFCEQIPAAYNLTRFVEQV